MKTIHWLDIIFCILAMPGMMFLFPMADWVQWHASYVLLYIGWLYLVFFLCRRALGPLLLQGWRGIVTVLGVVFLIGVVTFIMGLTPVEFPRSTEWGAGLAPHIRAMWILLVAVVAYSLPIGMLATQVDRLTSAHEEDEAREALHNAVEARRAKAFSNEEIQVKSDYHTVRLPLAAVQYIEGRNNYSCFHLDNREDVVTQLPLKRVLEMLPDGKFVRIHRSYIVPVWRIEKQTATYVKMLGMDTKLPVGRAHKENLKNG